MTFSNGVTRACVGTNATSFAPFSLASDITNIVSRSTNEVWHWYASSVNNHPFDAHVSVATNGPSVAYSILGEPVAPWTDEYGANTNAWVTALDVVCSNGWAGGSADFSEVAGGIACAIFDSNHFQYETKHGRTMFLNKDGSFTLSLFLAALKRPGKADLNCSDCAHAVTSLGNLVGCSLWSSVMEDTVGGLDFETRPYCAIGRTDWTPPRWGWGFSYHEVAWDGNANDSDRVFDACLNYDGDADPTSEPRTKEQPVDVAFSDGNPSAPFVYRERLTPSGTNGYDRCLSNPSTKIRLPVR